MVPNTSRFNVKSLICADGFAGLSVTNMLSVNEAVPTPDTLTVALPKSLPTKDVSPTSAMVTSVLANGDKAASERNYQRALEQKNAMSVYLSCKHGATLKDSSTFSSRGELSQPLTSRRS